MHTTMSYSINRHSMCCTPERRCTVLHIAGTHERKPDIYENKPNVVSPCCETPCAGEGITPPLLLVHHPTQPA